ncbi:MAG TPA: ATP-binding protein [Terriglobales bacterium]|jgi:serine/threonine-protein kinase RsbW|nr:ATP-binding protein [Terriglobales bacterium]
MSTDSQPAFDFLAEKLLFKLQVTLSADKAAVDSVVQRIMESIREKDCAGGKEQAIELALSEALANAVVHGAKSDASKVVECDVACDQNRSLLIVVRDPGEGFDPAAIPSPVLAENIYSGHGRGVYLITQLMDEVKFLKNGTEIHMIKR